MLEGTTSCSLAGLCLCLLAVSASDLTSSAIFCCTFLPLLLFGCPLFARFLIPSQIKPVAAKRHRKRGRLKTDTTVAYDSTGISLNGALANGSTLEVLASPFKLWIADGRLTFFIAMGIVLAVAGVVATALTPAARAVVQVEDGKPLPNYDETICCSCSGNSANYGGGGGISAAAGKSLGVASSATAATVTSPLETLGAEIAQAPAAFAVATDQLGPVDGNRLGLGGGDQLAWGGGDGLGWGGSDRLRSDSGVRLRWWWR